MAAPSGRSSRTPPLPVNWPAGVGREHGSVRPFQAWSCIGAAQDSDLVAQHEELDNLGRGRSAHQQDQPELWVPETLRTSCGLLIFVEEAAESVVSFDLGDLGRGAVGE
jgi:hypothetical protein